MLRMAYYKSANALRMKALETNFRYLKFKVLISHNAIVTVSEGFDYKKEHLKVNSDYSAYFEN